MANSQQFSSDFATFIESGPVPMRCPHCLGLGLDPDLAKRVRGRRASTWTFNLADQCPRCDGEGEIRP